MNNKDNHILSIDIGGSKLLVGIIDYDGRIIESKKMLLKPHITEKGLESCIKDIVFRLDYDISSNYIKCAGVAAPGLADKVKKTLVYAPFSGLRDFPVGKIIGELVKVPVYVENDANACAIGEMTYGACQNVDDFIWITVSNGVGGAVVIKKNIYDGCCGGAGEIGHIVVAENGYRCGCGNRGCLEVHAAGPAIVRRYKEKTGINKSGLNAKNIAEAAKKGEKAAIEVYKKTGYYLGKAISYAVNLLNPAKVILGGGISIDIELILPEIKKIVRDTVIHDSNKNLIIQKTELSYEAALIGAAAAAKKSNGGI